MRAEYLVSLMATFQYRVQTGMELLGLLMESLIYLVVWTTVARAQGGEVGGFTADEFAGYFIAWTFVRNITTGWSPFWFEHRIRRGEFNSILIRPVHPFFTDMGRMLGMKTTASITLIPTMFLMTLLFKPTFTLIPWSLLVMVPAIILAFLLRYTLMYALALTTFWTTRVTALFELYFAIEFFVSGRIAPLSVLPIWAQNIAEVLPFQWMFYFPLELLLGRLAPEEVAFGFLMQALWLGASLLTVRLSWRGAVKQYTAVGG
jgi:ABC-2 type transport system permease protein